MTMTMKQFTVVCKHIYDVVDTGHFSFDDCMYVFDKYFSVYEDFTEMGHPVPSYSKIAEIMEKMPFADTTRKIDLEPEDYDKLILAYFMHDFKDCDYNIAHFFSGDIRKYRYYETIY